MSEQQQPSLAAVAIATGLLGLLAGYFIGQGSSIGLFGGGTAPSTSSASGKKNKPIPKKSWPNSYDVQVHVDSSDEELMAQLADNESDEDEDEDADEDEDLDGGEGDGKELKSFQDLKEEVKLVLAVRTDLGMTKGKIAAQCGHATLACYKYLNEHAPSAALLQRWEYTGQAKIAVKVDSEDDLLTLQAQAMSLGLCARVIRDAGRTQIAAGSSTVLGVLGPKSMVDQVTGHLKLL